MTCRRDLIGQSDIDLNDIAEIASVLKYVPTAYVCGLIRKQSPFQIRIEYAQLESHGSWISFFPFPPRAKISFVLYSQLNVASVRLAKDNSEPVGRSRGLEYVPRQLPRCDH